MAINHRARRYPYLEGMEYDRKVRALVEDHKRQTVIDRINAAIAAYTPQIAELQPQMQATVRQLVATMQLVEPETKDDLFWCGEIADYLETTDLTTFISDLLDDVEIPGTIGWEERFPGVCTYATRNMKHLRKCLISISPATTGDDRAS